MNITRDREIIARLTEMMSTVDEAFHYMDEQLNALEFEKAVLVFEDTLRALKTLSEIAMLLDLEDAGILRQLRKVRKAAHYAVEAHEDGKMPQFKMVLEDYLFPAYRRLKKRLEVIVSGERFRYLQN